VKYRILALLDKLTFHKTNLCGWCWDYEMSQRGATSDEYGGTVFFNLQVNPEDYAEAKPR